MKYFSFCIFLSANYFLSQRQIFENKNYLITYLKIIKNQSLPITYYRLVTIIKLTKSYKNSFPHMTSHFPQLMISSVLFFFIP